MNFKFVGSIDCNTEIELEDITYDEYTGIEKFIKALRNANFSFVAASTSINGVVNNHKILEVGTKLWFTKRLEDIIYNSNCARLKWYDKLQIPIERKVLQVIINKDGISYQISGGLHINQDMIGRIAFLNRDDAIENMKK